MAVVKPVPVARQLDGDSPSIQEGTCGAFSACGSDDQSLDATITLAPLHFYSTPPRHGTYVLFSTWPSACQSPVRSAHCVTKLPQRRVAARRSPRSTAPRTTAPQIGFPPCSLSLDPCATCEQSHARNFALLLALLRYVPMVSHRRDETAAPEKTTPPTETTPPLPATIATPHRRSSQASVSPRVALRACRETRAHPALHPNFTLPLSLVELPESPTHGATFVPREHHPFLQNRRVPRGRGCR